MRESGPISYEARPSPCFQRRQLRGAKVSAWGDALTAISVSHARVALTTMSLSHSRVALTNISVSHSRVALTAISLSHSRVALTTISVSHSRVALAAISLSHSRVALTTISVSHSTISLSNTQHAAVVLRRCLTSSGDTSGDTTLCGTTGVTLHGVVSPDVRTGRGGMAEENAAGFSQGSIHCTTR